MIVYGDPKFAERTTRLLSRLKHCLQAVDPQELGSLRTLLIQCGQMEQAVVDNLPASNVSQIKTIQATTEHAARAFYASLQECFAGLTAPQCTIRDSLDLMSLELGRLKDLEDSLLVVKIPEGFEFYTLYPEQYCASAVQWLKHHPSSKDRATVVVGIRSIGTSLSALVAVTLSAAGWQTTRATVRPSGHPFQRTAELNLPKSIASQHALIVDEGPGISGSSFVAVAEALIELGFDPEKISFLPGHENVPGPAVSPQTRARWISTARHVVPLQNLRWNGHSLTELLTDKSNLIRDQRDCFNQVEDLSAGMWRAKLYSSETRWPAVCLPFEKTKYLCCSRDGPGILWKFSGLGSMHGELDSPVEQLNNESSHGLGKQPHYLLDLFHGFEAQPWVMGTPLTPGSAADSAVMSAVESAIIANVGSPLSSVNQSESVHRLSEMLFHNTKEAFSESVAQHTLTWARSAENLPPLPGSGDGRLEPHHWIQRLNGSYVKTAASNRLPNHTIVGRQPILWDIAGMMIEWRLHDCPIRLRSLIREALLPPVQSEVLKFYLMAYAAFRMGQTSFCANLCNSNAGEKMRLNAASDFYRNRLAMELRDQASDNTEV